MAAGCPPRTEHRQDFPMMDAEQINAIGSRLADLSQRTVELRRYL
jgi:hypothetical protein